LATLSVVATAPEVFAATSAAGSASAAAQSSGGSPLLASIWAYLGALVNALFLPLATFFGTFFGAWNSIRNSPTLRSRRFMLKAVIFQTLMGVSLGIFFMMFGRSSALCLIMIDETSMETFGWIFGITVIIVIGSYCVISSYAINRLWRKIVEEDISRPMDIETLEQSNLSLRSLRRFLYCSLTMPFIALLLTMPSTMIVIELCTSLRWWTYFEWMSFFPETDAVETCAAVFFLLLVIIPTLIISTYVIGMKTSNENSISTWQPKIPNYLQVLIGEEKPKRGLRYRTNLWNDLLLIGVGLCMLQSVFFESFGKFVVFVISFIAYLLFAMFFAGIPRKRYYGFIYLGVFIAVLDTIFILFTTQHNVTMLMLGCVLFWLSCFILSGVLGLYAFRKKT